MLLKGICGDECCLRAQWRNKGLMMILKKKKRLEGSHYKICVQESSIKGWRGATRTDTSNRLEYLREVTELDAEGIWQGCFPQMGQESRFTMRQKNHVLHMKCRELVFFPHCLQSAHNEKEMRYWR